MTQEELRTLALKYFQGNTSPEEEALLHQWYDEGLESDDEVVVDAEIYGKREVSARLLSRLQFEIQKDNVPRRPSSYVNIKRLSYAASFLLIISISFLVYFSNGTKKSEVHRAQLLNNDIGPGGNSAVLELSDGSAINLDEVTVGSLINGEGLVINKLSNGILSLEFSKSSSGNAPKINTIRTPQGGQYQIKLPDGSDVWLNSSSSIKFPSVFSSLSRNVELEGEAYFEIATLKNSEDRRLPFFVKNKNQLIEVLGTRFNVSSYADEMTTRTTLLEGSVNIHLTNGSEAVQQLSPGEESNVFNDTIQVQHADLEAAMAWKNGDFIFNNESLESIMRKIARWYGVEVIYQDAPIERKFSGAVSRTKNLSDVLKIMELTGKVSFKISGRRVLVMS